MNNYIGQKKRNYVSTVIKTNRLLKNMTQRKLCEDICATSYLSKIENNEVEPSKEILEKLYDKLSLTRTFDQAFIKNSCKDVNAFYNDYMFNEFDVSNKRFINLEDNEINYLSSEFILDYLIAKMSFNSAQNRKVFSDIKSLLSTLTERMTDDQKYHYFLCLGVDHIKVINDNKKALQYFELAGHFGNTGQLNYWWGYYYLKDNQPLIAMRYLETSLRMHFDNTNIVGIINGHDLMGLVHYYVSEYTSGIVHYKKALKFISVAKNSPYEANIRNQIAWGYMRLNDYDMARDYIVEDRYNSDITINASVIKFFIAYYLKSPVMMDALKPEFSYRNRSLHRMIFSLLQKENYFDKNGTWLIGDDEIDALCEFAQFTHFEVEKAFSEIFANHYAKLENYKRAYFFAKSLSNDF